MGTLNNAVNTANQNKVEIRGGQSKNMFKPYAKKQQHAYTRCTTHFLSTMKSVRRWNANTAFYFCQTRTSFCPLNLTSLNGTPTYNQKYFLSVKLKQAVKYTYLKKVVKCLLTNTCAKA